ncbi:SIS domain-containing protein [Novispirillum sp. DQ9]|uniref:D-sedoheptulose-7-phosphate isomerase n=1 Tax=Novispirillum sp. DQ9 TaxID=3398612 RepID=UPI003C7D9DF5
MSDIQSYLRGAADALSTAAADTALADGVIRAVAAVTAALRAGKSVLVAGNGGSMADAQHIAGELTARFRLERPGLPVLALGTNAATLTAWSNDYDYASAYAREVEAYGVPGGVFIGLSTSGNSKNIVAAAEKARARGLTVIALTGAGGGKLAALADILLAAPSTDTPRIQEVHIALYHFLCEQVEAGCA